ncbi:unnamed protein product [Arctogadus glacialis]
MAAVEYGECPSIHTSRLARFEYGIRVLEVYLFSPDLNWNVLRTLILSAQYGQYGYWNTALVFTGAADNKYHRCASFMSGNKNSDKQIGEGV